MSNRKKVEEALQESEEKYRTLTDGLKDVVYQVSLTGKLEYVSNAVKEFGGYKPEEEVGSFIGKYFAKKTELKKALIMIKKIAVDRTSATTEFLYKPKDKDPFYVEVTGNPLIINNKVVSVIGVKRNISERKRTEEHALRQSAVLDAINKVFRETLRCETEEEVARTCLAVAEELTGSKFGWIGEVNESGRLDTIAQSDPGWKACRIPKSDAARMVKDMEVRGIWGSVLRDGRSLIVNDPASHPDRVGIPEGHPPLTSFLGVPLKREGKIIGMISLANRDGGYSLADQEDIEALSVAFLEALIRKRAEGALKKSEKQLRNVLDGLGPHMFVGLMTPDGTLVEANRPALEIAGLKPEDVRGKPFEETYWWSYSESVKQQLRDAIRRAAKGETSRYDVAVRVGENRFITIDFCLRPLVGEGGRINYLIPSAVDITERKLAKEKLEESERFLSNVFESIQDGISVLDNDMNIVRVNPVMEKWYSRAMPLVGKKCYEAYHERDKICEICPSRQTRESGEAAYEVVPYCGAGGEIIGWLDLYSFPLIDSKTGKIAGVIEYVRDITERKKAEEELKRSAIYLDAMPDILCVTSPEGKIIKVNQTFYNLWDYSPEEVIGRPAVEMFSHEERPKIKKETKTAIKTGHPRHFETSILTKHGEEVPVSLSEMALKSDEGKVTAIVTVLKDITIPKKAESALRQAYDEIKTVDELKSDIIANVTHELRTPITIVRGAMEMAMQEENPEERVALLKMAMEALTRQNSIIGDLIAATRIERGREHEIEAVDLSAIIPLVSNEFKALLIKNKLDLKIDMDENLPFVMADHEGLLHILRNLISNAIKFNNVGGTVAITAVEKGGFVEVCVSDTGIGMSKDVRERVFERFYQADSSSGRAYSGIGLGLTIVKEMVKINRGEIHVKSKTGKGTTFCFTLLSALS